jgi:hypothetical protein
MDTELMQTLNFTAEDIEANRRGEFSERQWAKLPRPDWRRTLINLGYGVAFLVALAAVWLSWNQSGDLTNVLAEFSLYTAVLVIGGFALYFFYRAYERRPQLPSEFEVKCVTGEATLSSGVLSSGREVYRVRIDDPAIVVKDPVFAIPQDAYHTFKQGRRYQVYHVPGVGILSAETEPAPEPFVQSRNT